jgi:hypothetical protein
MWCCVLRISDYEAKYLGQDESAAAAANVAGTYLAEGYIVSEAYETAKQYIDSWRR